MWFGDGQPSPRQSSLDMWRYGVRGLDDLSNRIVPFSKQTHSGRQKQVTYLFRVDSHYA